MVPTALRRITRVPGTGFKPTSRTKGGCGRWDDKNGIRLSIDGVAVAIHLVQVELAGNAGRGGPRREPPLHVCKQTFRLWFRSGPSKAAR